MKVKIPDFHPEIITVVSRIREYKNKIIFIYHHYFYNKGRVFSEKLNRTEALHILDMAQELHLCGYQNIKYII